ncbi:MAG: Stk1 family PASTA domain-containing Ser/Thr kinase [Actinobacteria bacterium]|nr:Stk1 family PASTA domain-containing Ser/Thr kinase [Actinomycetota bacterium]MCG2820221.1 Stk1 family PASTA domain-containing Ser/Thr kinase [Actinomycetes bacterium]MBU4179141.1 Stk1 family PASTA domain-containing Ser/Thr kinase [Actinomycetota bacterium]MBU4219372.1 Stk1 family PASTA domain-containing Ser/Thr kinase [Actinomycetota bacterium]MBU4360087.1 Stk1 family PASTA domain-containing Ser/Thr kinase [Actinomycetota bacterium]
MIGTTLNGRYEIEELIGTGGMADVFRARDNLLGRTVAVKVLHAQYAKDPVFIQRFRQEAQSAGNLNQPNVVNVYDWGIEGDTYYLVMEYVEGHDLKDVILSGGPLLPERAVEITLNICAALEAAHAQGIIHRDIKPQNIFITSDNQVKVMDFGIARSAGGTAMTQTGTIMGTAQYISPEQAQGQTADQRSDLYSLGVVLYEMLTGKPPFDGDTPVSIAYKHVREDPLPPSMVNPDVSPELEAVVMKALSKNPENRYQNVVEMQADLERGLEGFPVYATPVLPLDQAGATRAYPLGGAPKRSLTWLWIIIIVLLLLGIGAGVWAIVGGSGGISVPNVVGETVDNATTILSEKGLKMKISKTVIDVDKPEGVVISQDPQKGISISKGETVNVVVTEAAVAVPNLSGISQSEAEAALKSVGLELQGVSQQYSQGAEKGIVISQSPSADTQVSKGSSVSIVVSKGPELVTVPEVVGLDQSNATQRLESAGFQVNAEESPSSTETAGTVLSQSPEGGSQVPKGSAVTIEVATKPDTATVPDVIGDLESDARQTIIDAGFEPVITYESTTPANVGRVLGQSPVKGTEAEKGSQVTIRVGKAEEV